MPSRHLLAALGAPLAVAVVASCFAEIDEGLLATDAAADAFQGGAADVTAPDGAAAPDTALEAGGADAGGDAAYLGVACGDGAACIAPAIVCCSATFGDTDYRRGTCFTRADCPTGDFFTCERGRDCTYPGAAGPRCCVLRVSGGNFTQTKCTDACTEGELCDADHPCGGGKACRASAEFPALFDCQ